MMTDEEKLDDLTAKALEEFARDYDYEERLPGDLDATQIAKKLSCAFSTARNRMAESIESGEWEERKVLNPETGKSTKIIRRVQKVG